MASYTQWRALADKGEVKRVTWVCGSERVLVEELVDHVRSTLAVSDLDYACLVAGSTKDRDIWAAANQYPTDPTAPRLVVIREAQLIKRWAGLFSWLDESRLLPTVHLLFVSSEADLDTELEHQARIRDRGRVIRCAPLEQEAAIAWVCRQAPVLDKLAAAYLLTRTGGDLGRARSVCQKLALFPQLESVTDATIDTLCSVSPASEFVDALLLLNRPAAFEALEAMTPDTYARGIGLLDSRLDLLERLHFAVKRKMGMREIAGMRGVPVFLARKYIGVAKHYDPASIRHRRQLLSVVDSAVFGATPQPASMEALISLW